MTSPSLPVVRRRFLAMLWLSAALHAAVLGLVRLPPPLSRALPPELQVRLMQPAPALTAKTLPEARSAPLPARPAPPARVKPEPLIQVMPQPEVAPAVVPVVVPAPQAAPVPAPAPAPSVTVSAPSRDAPGPTINIPLMVDPRYYSARELDVQPTALRKPEPLYPPQAEEQEVSGRVVLRLHLETDGSVSRIEVVSVTPGGVFGELFRKSTLDSLRAIRFRPAQRNGQPVRAVVEIPVVFEPDR